MMTGVILTNGTPVIAALKVRGSREEVIVEGILDTGFTGFLCLPISLAVPLGLELTDTTTSELADGTIVESPLGINPGRRVTA
jgi:predicted aspartyl protease